MEVFLGTKHKDKSLVSVPGDVRSKHLTLLGKSGVGKTTLIRNMVIADLIQGNGVTVIDPHGQLVEDLLSCIPRHRTNEVIYLNPSHPNRVVGLNVLQSIGPDDRHHVVSSIISILHNLYPANWGPRTEWVLEHVVYALLEQKDPAILAAIPKLLLDHQYRQRVMKNVSDPAIKGFFEFYELQNQKLREESIAPLLNKVAKFNTNPLLRAVIGQTTSSFDFREVMDSGKILLCNLSKGALGEDVSSLLGSLLVSKLALASLSRQDIPESERRPHYLYVDEVQGFTHGVDLPTILSESRKYRLSLTIGSQTLTLLPDSSVAAIFGNCAVIISFRVSAGDAKQLVREFAASGEGLRTAEQMYDIVVPASELQNLPDYHFYVRTLQAGQPVAPFLVEGSPPLSGLGRPNARETVIRKSLERYGRDRAEVERKLKRFLRPHPDRHGLRQTN